MEPIYLLYTLFFLSTFDILVECNLRPNVQVVSPQAFSESSFDSWSPQQIQQEQQIEEDDESERVPHPVKGAKKNSTVAIPTFQVTVPECGLSRFSAKDIERIVGGRPAMSGQFPWQVYLRISTKDGDMLCGGSILNPTWILTAAHCVSSEQTGQYMADSIEVVAGSINRANSYERKRQSRYADCAFKHPEWKGVGGGFANDIALVRLPSNSPLDLNYLKGGDVNGICLPPKTHPNFDYVGIARVSGWGLTRDRGIPSRTLQYTDINIISDRQCRTYQYPVNIIDSMVCQGVDNSSPCQGDSGGPLIIRSSNRFVQFGLVSFGPGICNNGRIPNAVYTQVSYHLSWIENTIRSYQDNASCEARRIKLN